MRKIGYNSNVTHCVNKKSLRRKPPLCPEGGVDIGSKGKLRDSNDFLLKAGRRGHSGSY